MLFKNIYLLAACIEALSSYFHHVKISKLICRTKQLTGFNGWEKLYVCCVSTNFKIFHNICPVWKEPVIRN